MEKIAIIGTGIAAMGCAYFLKEEYDITFFEKNAYPGGHTNTVTYLEDGQPIYIDTGFMVYNEITYPNLTRFFQELEIPTRATSMSFSVHYGPTGLEYCGTGLSGLFAQRRNVLRPSHWKFLLEIDRFNKQALEVLANSRYQTYDLAEYCRERNFSSEFLNQFLVPMSSAVWSTPPDKMLKFPAVTLVQFFKNHGFLGLSTHYQWRTPVNGSRVYRDKVLGFFKNKVFLNRPAVRVSRESGKVLVQDAHGKVETFSKVIVACHADQALPLLTAPTPQEAELLSRFRYQSNRATLHTDEKVMPWTRRAWSSWNYRIAKGKDGQWHPTTIYYMNSLQQVSQRKDYFVSINDPGEVDPQKILQEIVYEHPLFDVPAMAGQARLSSLNTDGPVFFCGSYFKYGFHEDALNSALALARRLSRKKIWE